MQRRSTTSSDRQSDSFGMLLRHWREQRGYSQLDLALTSQVSQRHISFLHLKRECLELQFFSTIATLGTPYDITLQELRIECLFPADAITERNWK